MRIFAFFMHNQDYGRSIGGIERRFIEMSRQMQSMSKVFALEFYPSLSKKMRVGYVALPFPRTKPKSVTEELFLLLKLTLVSVISCRRLRSNVIYSVRQDMPEAFFPALVTSLVLSKPLVIVFHSLPKNGYDLKTPLRVLLKSRIAQREGIRKSFVRTTIDLARRVAYHRASICFAVSYSTSRQIREFFSPKRLVVSGNGVSHEWYSPNETPKTFDVVYCGRIHPRKRLELLIEAWKDVLKRYPDAKLLLAGGGETNHIESYRRMVEDLGLTKNVSITGFLEDSAMRSSLRSSRIFAFPSSREGFGLAVAEAMACGLPCVLADIPSLRESFSSAAIFVSGSQPSDWADAFIELMGDEEKQKSLSESSKRVANSFRWKDVASKEVLAMSQCVS